MITGIAILAIPSGIACASKSSIWSISSVKTFLMRPVPISFIFPRGCFSSLPCKEIRRFFNVLYALTCENARPCTYVTEYMISHTATAATLISRKVMSILSPLVRGEMIWYKKKYGSTDAIIPIVIMITAHTVYFLYSPIYGATRLNILRFLPFS